jgi:hypothetical protein
LTEPLASGLPWHFSGFSAPGRQHRSMRRPPRSGGALPNSKSNIMFLLLFFYM